MTLLATAIRDNCMIGLGYILIDGLIRTEHVWNGQCNSFDKNTVEIVVRKPTTSGEITKSADPARLLFSFCLFSLSIFLLFYV